MSQNKDDIDTPMFLWLALLLIVLLVIPALYAAKAGVINGAFLAFAKVQLRPFVPFSDEAQRAWVRISALDLETLTWKQVQGVLTYTGKWIRWPLALLLGLLGVASLFMTRTKDLIRRLNMESLLRNNAESFPCLRPIVGRGKYLLSPESFDSGLWRVARSPIQFAVENELLLNKNGTPFTPEEALRMGLGSKELPAYGQAVLDETKTLEVLQTQLGPAFTGFKELSPCRQALAAAFLSYANGDKKGCLAILDAVASSYSEDKGIATCPVLAQWAFQRKLEKAWKRHKNILAEPSLARHSSYELSWFMALLTRARQKGVLAGSQFLWLRPLDRPLWYALNQCGGRAAWPEGAAAWAHHAAEDKAGQTLPEPHVSAAVAGLRNSLAAQGWFIDTPGAAIEPQSSPDSGDNLEAVSSELDSGASGIGIEPMPNMVYAEAEDDPEYDANDDPILAQELY